MENSWNLNQTKKLFGLARDAQRKGKGLSFAFLRVAEETGRSVNSVRNYYYSQLKMFELVPKLASDLGIELINSQRERFELFTEEEIVSLVEEILIAKAKGISVRRTINKISKGDSKIALRLQNKYRSMVSNHKDRVCKVMATLSQKGVKFYNPYTKLVSTKTHESNHKKLQEYISSLDEKEVGSFLDLMQKLFA